MTRKTRKTSFRRSIAVLAVSVLALAGLGGAAGASAAAPAPTKVVIVAESGGFHGFVKSSKLSCKSERTVVLYKQLGAKQSPRSDERVGMDTSAEDGEWDMGNPGLHEGRYYARATVKPGCKAANSITLRAQE